MLIGPRNDKVFAVSLLTPGNYQHRHVTFVDLQITTRRTFEEEMTIELLCYIRTLNVQCTTGNGDPVTSQVS